MFEFYILYVLAAIHQCSMLHCVSVAISERKNALLSWPFQNVLLPFTLLHFYHVALEI